MTVIFDPDSGSGQAASDPGIPSITYNNGVMTLNVPSGGSIFGSVNGVSAPLGGGIAPPVTITGTDPATAPLTVRGAMGQIVSVFRIVDPSNTQTVVDLPADTTVGTLPLLQTVTNSDHTGGVNLNGISGGSQPQAVQIFDQGTGMVLWASTLHSNNGSFIVGNHGQVTIETDPAAGENPLTINKPGGGTGIFGVSPDGDVNIVDPGGSGGAIVMTPTGSLANSVVIIQPPNGTTGPLLAETFADGVLSVGPHGNTTMRVDSGATEAALTVHGAATGHPAQALVEIIAGAQQDVASADDLISIKGSLGQDLFDVFSDGSLNLATQAGASNPVIYAQQNETTQDIAQFRHAGGALVAKIGNAGELMTAAHVAPTILTGQLAIWFDQTNGAAKLMIKAAQADGTIVTGSVTLA